MEKAILVAIILLTAATMYFVLPMVTSKEKQNKKDYRGLKQAELDNVPDEELENAVIEWLFAKIDTKGTTEVPIMRAMPLPCRYVYAVYIVSGEVFSLGFGAAFRRLDSFFLSTATEGFLAMGSEKLAGIMERACVVAGEYIRDNGRDMSGLENNEEMKKLTGEFEACDEAFKLSDFMIHYIKDNREFFGD